MPDDVLATPALGAASLRRLLDEQELLELVTRYCRAIDRCDEELLLSVYHPDAYDHHGAFAGSREGFVEYLRGGHLDPEFGPLQHSISNTMFAIDGDTAYGEVYVETRNVMGDGELLRGLARYVDRYERRDGEWRILDRRVCLEHARPGYDIALFAGSARDRSDPSYARAPLPRVS